MQFTEDIRYALRQFADAPGPRQLWESMHASRFTGGSDSIASKISINWVEGRSRHAMDDSGLDSDGRRICGGDFNRSEHTSTRRPQHY